MKLIIQIPCYNEQEQLAETFASLPRSISGIDRIEVLIVDDGSSDATSVLARALGAHHIVRQKVNLGLAAAFSAGQDACLRLGADIMVNTDADNQYSGADIARLLEPILSGRADMVVGDRGTDDLAHFSLLKRRLQRWGSGLVRRASGLDVKDSTSGFRAFNRKAMYALFTHNRFSYTLESLIQAGHLGVVVENVPVQARMVERPSRLFRSLPDYLRRNGPVIFRSYAMYRPARTFGLMASGFLVVGAVLIGRFFLYYFANPGISSHVQSLQIGVGAVVLAFVVGLMALLGDLIAANRRLTEEILARLRRMDGDQAAQGSDRPARLDGIDSTGAPPWTAEA